MILSAQSIRTKCTYDHNPTYNMVRPFHERTEVVWRDGKWSKPYALDAYDKKVKRFSYGLSSCGYDVRIAESMWLWPLFGRLASTIEKFVMPKGIMAEVKDKSSWARRFVTVQNTVIEPGWRGTLTLELTNHRPWPRFIRAGTPIAQIVFKRLDYDTDQPYRGKYQDQAEGPQPAR